MMYRCGWATKLGQEVVLGIRIQRKGFEWALSHGCLSSAKKAGVSQDQWPAYKKRYAVRIQWDPERDIALNRLEHRSVQIGLSGEAVHRYVNDWILEIEDRTQLAKEIHELVQMGKTRKAVDKLPKERVYPASGPWKERLRVHSEVENHDQLIE